jgi:hypothetical protein
MFVARAQMKRKPVQERQTFRTQETDVHRIKSVARGGLESLFSQRLAGRFLSIEVASKV